MPENETNTVKYQVISVDKIVAPDGMPGNNWYCYVIGRDSSKIKGQKPGTLNDVTRHAEAVAEDLNVRSQTIKSVYAPKQNQNKTRT